MKVEMSGVGGIRVDLVGFPWNRKKYGPPYVRFETKDGKYVASPKYKELLKLKKMVDIAVRCEREFDPKKRTRT